MQPTRPVIINGYPGSGKTTFAELCGKFGLVEDLYTSTPAKKALYSLGWDGTKTPESRNLLADMMNLSYTWNGPITYIGDEFAKSAADIVFIHCREPENIRKLENELYMWNPITLFINRPVHEAPTNENDANVEKYPYDLIIDNTGTLEELEEEAGKFVDIIKKGRF